MKPSTILLTAANNLISKPMSGYACHEITYVQNHTHDIGDCDADTQLAFQYFLSFKPYDVEDTDAWFGDTHFLSNQEDRCLALCFAAQIAFDNGD